MVVGGDFGGGILLRFLAAVHKGALLICDLLRYKGVLGDEGGGHIVIGKEGGLMTVYKEFAGEHEGGKFCPALLCGGAVVVFAGGTVVYMVHLGRVGGGDVSFEGLPGACGVAHEVFELYTTYFYVGGACLKVAELLCKGDVGFFGGDKGWRVAAREGFEGG